MVSTLEQMQVPNGTGPGVRRSKRPLDVIEPVIEWSYLVLSRYYLLQVIIYQLAKYEKDLNKNGREIAERR